MARFTRQDVYDALDFDNWKTGYEIRRDLMKKKGLEDPFELGPSIGGIIALFKQPSYEMVNVHLRHLEDEGSVEKRSRDDSMLTDSQREQRRRIRSDLPYEYRPICRGKRVPVDEVTRETDFGIGGIVPA